MTNPTSEIDEDESDLEADESDAEDSDDEVAEPIDASTRMTGCQYVAGTDGTKIIIPWSYEVWQTGVFKVKEGTEPGERPEMPTITDRPGSAWRDCLTTISLAPIWLAGLGKNLADDTAMLLLRYWSVHDHGYLERWVTQGEVADKHQLIRLASFGVPVSDGNVRELQDYLTRAHLQYGHQLPRTYIASRSGPYRAPAKEGEAAETREWGWLIGRHWIGPQHFTIQPDIGALGQMSDGFGVGGSEEEWHRKWLEVAALGPVPRWLLYSTYAAPLLEPLRVRSFIIHHFGLRGGGKSALAFQALSAYGSHRKLSQHFNSTGIAPIELFQYVTGLPVLFDELQASTIGASSKLIYAMALEKGRLRSGRSGGLQAQVQQWTTIVRCTGEKALIEDDLGGQAIRTLQFAGPPALAEERATDVQKWLQLGHYGWGGREFLRLLCSFRNSPSVMAMVEQKFADLSREIGERALREKLDCGAARQLQLGVIALAQHIAQTQMYGQDEGMSETLVLADAMHMLRLIVDQTAIERIEDRGLAHIRDHYQTNPHMWLDITNPEDESRLRHHRYKNLYGVLTETEVWVLQRPANEDLRRSNIQPYVEVWRRLKDRGILITRGATLPQTRTRLPNFDTRVYVLNREAAGFCCGADTEGMESGD